MDTVDVKQRIDNAAEKLKAATAQVAEKASKTGDAMIGQGRKLKNAAK